MIQPQLDLDFPEQPKAELNFHLIQRPPVPKLSRDELLNGVLEIKEMNYPKISSYVDSADSFRSWCVTGIHRTFYAFINGKVLVRKGFALCASSEENMLKFVESLKKGE